MTASLPYRRSTLLRFKKLIPFWLPGRDSRSGGKFVSGTGIDALTHLVNQHLRRLASGPVRRTLRCRDRGGMSGSDQAKPRREF
jgi:hypothetical protein